jgi:hypothetical protein
MDRILLLQIVLKNNNAVLVGAWHIVQQGLAREQMNRERRKKRKEFWVHFFSWLRVVHGHYDTLMQEMLNDEHYGYKQYIRMEAGLFQEILAHIEHCIRKRNTTFRMALPAGMKMAFTL